MLPNSMTSWMPKTTEDTHQVTTGGLLHESKDAVSRSFEN